MPDFPKKDTAAQTRSNLSGKLVAQLHEMTKASNRLALPRLEREFRRARAGLIKPADRKVAARLFRDAEAAWQRASLAAGGDADRRSQLKAGARDKLERSLARLLPGFRAYRALRRDYLRQRGKIRGSAGTVADRGLTLGLGALENNFTVDIQEFSVPYPRYERLTGDLAGLLKQDDSLVWPDSGQWLQNFSFEHNESSWGVSSRSTFVDHLVSCGVDFTLPRDGRLQVGAEIENFSNRLNCAISDNFGFSHSYLEAAVNLFIAILRENAPVEYYQVPLLTSFLSSEGDDLSRSISDLNTFEPYAVGALSLRAIPAGEPVTVLAGTRVRIVSDTDDMDAHIRATYWWKLRKLQLAVL